MTTARSKPAVITVTEAAAARIRDIVAGAEQPAVGVRVGITKGGCAGMSYQMDLAREVARGDEVVDAHGVRVLVDPKAVLYLLGSEMDFIVDKLSARFVFRNPNEVSACGCGESVSLTPAKGEEAAPHT
jgi:iron-sulfur cluster assembly protein